MYIQRLHAQHGLKSEKVVYVADKTACAIYVTRRARVCAFATALWSRRVVQGVDIVVQRTRMQRWALRGPIAELGALYFRVAPL
jgi:hypothetical protein